MPTPSTSSVVDEVLRYKKTLESSPSDDELLEVFKLLDVLEVDRTLLSKTKIGIAVHKHKQHEKQEISSMSRKLVEKWKSAIAASSKTSSSSSSSSSTNHAPKSSTSPAPQPTDASSISDASGSQSIFNDEIKLVNTSDAGIVEYSGPQSGDVKRDKAREILYRAFMEGLPAEQLAEIDRESAANLVGTIEDALWAHHIEKRDNNREYQAQLRSIKSNFADKKNPEFNIRVYLGAISSERIAEMASTEMASDAKKAERLKAKKDALEACQSDWDLRNIKRAAGQFPCGKCKSANTTYFQMQTRSSDEPMTTFVNCLNCGNRWKF